MKKFLAILEMMCYSIRAYRKRGLFVLDVLRTIFIIIDIIVMLILIAVVTIQSGKTAGLSGAIGGGSDTYLSKNKAKTFDAKLSRATKWIAGAFIVITLILNLL